MAAPRKKEEYQIGIICALATEKAAMVAMLDETHTKLPKDKTDPNDYTFGQIGVHDVVVACLPAGSMGIGPAAIVANNMKRSFNLQFGLMVGIAGGVWSKKADIRLGDVVVSQPTGLHGGVVQWDYGKKVAGGLFQRTGSLERPPPVLLHALQALKVYEEGDGIDLAEALSFMIKKKPRMAVRYEHQGIENDKLYEASYIHEGEETCDECKDSRLLARPPRESSTPKIHYGNIASGNEVMKDGLTRDRIAKEEGVICFEMEAAGLMNDFRCLVIRGICDYADSHKNDIWQPYAAATAAAFARTFLGFIDKQETVQISLPTIHTILPFSRNAGFIVREDIFKALDKLLTSALIYQTAAIWGLGGCGKTQIALEYAYRHQKKKSCSIFWVRGDSEASFTQDFNVIARAADLLSDLKAEDLLYAVKQWIEKLPSWLLLLDNVDDLRIFKTVYSDRQGLTDQPYRPELLRFVPKASNGTVIWTSRDKRVMSKITGMNRGIEVGPMTTQESLKFFQDQTGRPQTVKPSDVEKELLDFLEKLPLAIAQAAAFIRTTNISVSKYWSMLKELEQSQSNIMDVEFDDPNRGDVPNSVMKTWLISMRQIAHENPCAEKILNTIAFLDNQGLPFELIRAIAGPSFSEHEVLLAAGRLIDYSFLQAQDKVDEGSSVYREHRLVQLATRQAFNTAQKHLFSGKALEIMTKLFPNGDHETWSSCQLYLPHASKVSILTDTEGYCNQAPVLLANMGHYYWQQGRSDEAEKLEVQVLELQKSVLGEKHPDTITAMASLASTWWQQGRSDEAEKLDVQVLELQKSVLGEKHPDTITAMASLASTWWQQGRSDEAEKLQVQVLELQKSVLGEKHPDTITAMASLASTWWQQGRSDEAEKLQVQVLELQKSVLGEKHPDTITAMASLASTWWQQGRSDEAEKLQVQVLELQKSVLGEKHFDTITAMASLASTWWQQGRSDEAEKLQVQVLELQKSVLGEKHPDTITAMASLASTWWQQGRSDEAEKLQVQVLELQKSVLGEKHPDTIRAMASLASTWRQQGRLDEAEKLEVQVLELQKSVLGEKHPDTIRAMASLASTWWQQGRSDEAEKLQVQVLELQKSVLGEKHPDTITAMASLASTWWQQGRSDEAEKLEVQVLELQKSVLGEKHPDTIRAMASLASTWWQQGRSDEAEKLQVQVLELQKSVLGEKHPDTITAMASLASTWWQQGRSDEAEKLQVQVLELQKSVLGEKHPDTITAMASLASTWWQQGRSDEAEKLQVQVLELQKSVLGEKHPNTIRAMASLASTWWQQGCYNEAEKLEVRVLELRKSVLRDKHPDTILAMENLAATYKKQGRYSEAEKLELEALASKS